MTLLPARIVRLPLALLAVALAMVLTVPGATAQVDRDDVIHFDRGTVEIEASSGNTYAFDVELAIRTDQMTRGLMWRESMPMDEGMLFIFRDEAPRAFWMYNTLIPLDMIFIAGDGRIVNIVENAEPLTRTPRQSTGPARAVLELNGGVTRLLGIRAGDLVLHEAFGTR